MVLRWRSAGAPFSRYNFVFLRPLADVSDRMLADSGLAQCFDAYTGCLRRRTRSLSPGANVSRPCVLPATLLHCEQGGCKPAILLLMKSCDLDNAMRIASACCSGRQEFACPPQAAHTYHHLGLERESLLQADARSDVVQSAEKILVFENNICMPNRARHVVHEEYCGS